MSMKLLLFLVLLAVTGCSGAAVEAASGNGSGTPSAVASGPSTATADRAAAERIVDRFLQAANAGDRTAVAAVFAEEASFDSVGRIYPSRDDIMNRFLIPEVLEAGGKYKSTGSRWEADRLVVDYTFTTRSGANERFSYSYLIRDDLIRDVIGRYL